MQPMGMTQHCRACLVRRNFHLLIVAVLLSVVTALLLKHKSNSIREMLWQVADVTSSDPAGYGTASIQHGFIVANGYSGQQGSGVRALVQFDAVQKNNSLVDNWSVVRWFFLHKCLIGTCLLKSQGYQWLRSPSSEFQTVNWFSVCSHRLQKSSPHSEVFDHTSAGEYVYSSVGDHTIVGEHSTNFTSVFFFSPRLWGSLRCVQSVML